MSVVWQVWVLRWSVVAVLVAALGSAGEGVRVGEPPGSRPGWEVPPALCVVCVGVVPLSR